MLIAPPLLDLLDACRQAGEATDPDLTRMQGRLDAAVAFHNEGRAMFLVMWPTAPLKDGGRQAVDEVLAMYDRQKAALDGIAAAMERNQPQIVRQEGDRFADATNGLVEALRALGKIESQAVQQSPLPAVDQFIKTGINVIDGMIPGVILQDRFPMLINTVQTLRADLRRFEALHEAPPDLSREFLEAVEIMEAGLGGIIAWGREDDRDALVDGLRLLKRGSADAMRLLARMDQIGREARSFSTLLPLDEMARATRGFVAGKVPRDIVERCARNLHSLGEYYVAQVATVANFPLRFAVRPQWLEMRDSAQGLVQVAVPWLQTMESNPDAAARDAHALEGIRTAFEHASATSHRLQEALESAGRALAGAPQMEEMVDILGRLAVGTASFDYVTERVGHHLRVLDDLAREMDEANGPAELKTLVLGQLAAFYEMARFLDDGDDEHLRVGFEQLRDLHPQVMHANEELQRVVRAQRELRERSVACIRCGAMHSSSAKFCSRCQAVLPTVSSGEEIVYADLVGGTQQAGTPENLRRLQQIHDNVQAGGDMAAAADELSGMAGKLAALSADFERRVAPRVAKDENLHRFAVAFREELSAFIEGISAMREAAAAGNAALLSDALQHALRAGESMRATQAELQEGLTAR